MLNETTSDRQARDVTDVANGALGGRGSREFTSLEGKVPVASRFVFKGTVLLHCLAFRLYSFLPSVSFLSLTHTHTLARAPPPPPSPLQVGADEINSFVFGSAAARLDFGSRPLLRLDQTVQ